MLVFESRFTRRLVGEDDARAPDEGAGDGHTLLLAARELAWVVVAVRLPSPTRSSASEAARGARASRTPW